MLTYDLIQKEAERIGNNYRKKYSIPNLPTEPELRKYRKIIYKKFAILSKEIKKQVEKNTTWKQHGFEHLEEIALLSGYLAWEEYKYKKIIGFNLEETIDIAILSGLFHDIDRYLGFGEIHMIEGEKSTRKILNKYKEFTKYIDITAKTVRNHDVVDFKNDDKNLEFFQGIVFDADHFRYGLERDTTFWRMKEALGIKPEEVIHDYKFLPPLLCAWKTKWGKTNGSKFIKLGLKIAEEIEKKFS